MSTYLLYLFLKHVRFLPLDFPTSTVKPEKTMINQRHIEKNQREPAPNTEKPKETDPLGRTCRKTVGRAAG